MAQPDFQQAQRITYLISRYIKGDIDFAELQELENWRRTDESNESFFAELIDVKKQQSAIETMQAYDTDASLAKLQQAIRAGNVKRRIISMPLIKLLAAASLLIIGGLIYFFFYGHAPTKKIASLTSQPQYIPAGTDKAILTLADGKKVAINRNTKGIIATQSGVQINNTINGTVIYNPANQSTNYMTEYNTIETPKGGKYQLQLPDGTKVWLNAASSLHYPTAFKGKSRDVELTGEAYFEVAKDKSKPFTVTSEGQKVTVLGTHFNVNAYHDEGRIATTLVEGSVKVSYGDKQALLMPGLQSSLRNGEITVHKADIHLAIAWKDGQLAFLRTDLKSVLRQIARWYDIEVEYIGKVPNFTISGDVSRDADLSKMLEILKLYDVHFIQQGRKLIITN